MANLFDYITWRGDLDFDHVPFNPVDNLIFSQLSYLPMDGIVSEGGKKEGISLAELALYIENIKADSPVSRDITVVNATSVINAVKNSPRYEAVEVFGYVNNTDVSAEIQFSAFCAIIGKKRPSKKMLIVFRGTDSSLAGWKEDFQMSCTNSIPSQKEALSYLEKMAASSRLPLITAGHSKGGNLAIYASSFCRKSVQRRLTDIYSNDAPGFRHEVIQSDGYKAISARIRAFVPQSSFVGMLFEHGVDPRIIKSSGTGVFQHDLCTWKVSRDDLADGGKLTAQSRFVNDIVREWMGKIDEQQWRHVIGGLFKVLEATEVSSFVELASNWRNAVSIINGLKNIDSPTKKLMGEMIGQFLKTAGKNIRDKSLRKVKGRK